MALPCAAANSIWHVTVSEAVFKTERFGEFLRSPPLASWNTKNWRKRSAYLGFTTKRFGFSRKKSCQASMLGVWWTVSSSSVLSRSIVDLQSHLLDHPLFTGFWNKDASLWKPPDLTKPKIVCQSVCPVMQMGRIKTAKATSQNTKSF